MSDWKQEMADNEAKRLKEIAEARAFALDRDKAYAERAAEADTLDHQRIMDRDRLCREMLNATSMREQTAATILAALIVRGAPLEADNLAMTATLMADALRAELGVK